MIRNGSGGSERKVLVGTTPVFAVRLRQPPNSAPINVIFDPDSIVLDAPVTMSISAVRADDAIDGIDAHRMALTSSGSIAALSRQGIPGADFGAAFVITRDAGYFPVDVANIRAGSIILAGPLPHAAEVTSDEPAAVRYATYLGTLPAGVSATATAGRPIPWVCEYTADLGADLTAHAAQQERGVVHVRREIFDTGLDHQAFARMMRGPLALDGVYGAQSDWTPQIDAAHQALVNWVRGNVDSLGSDREDSINGGAFQLAHAYFTAMMIERSPEARAEFKAEAIAHAKSAAESLIETSPDTAIPEVRDHGNRASLLAGRSSSSSATTRRWYVGRPQ